MYVSCVYVYDCARTNAYDPRCVVGLWCFVRRHLKAIRLRAYTHIDTQTYTHTHMHARASYQSWNVAVIQKITPWWYTTCVRQIIVRNRLIWLTTFVRAHGGVYFFCVRWLYRWRRLCLIKYLYQLDNVICYFILAKLLEFAITSWICI